MMLPAHKPRPPRRECKLFREAEKIYEQNISHITGTPRPIFTKAEALAMAIEARFDAIDKQMKELVTAVNAIRYSTVDE